MHAARPPPDNFIKRFPRPPRKSPRRTSGFAATAKITPRRRGTRVHVIATRRDRSENRTLKSVFGEKKNFVKKNNINPLERVRGRYRAGTKPSTRSNSRVRLSSATDLGTSKHIGGVFSVVAKSNNNGPYKILLCLFRADACRIYIYLHACILRAMPRRRRGRHE